MSERFRRACLIAAVVAGSVFSAAEILHEVRLPIGLLPGVAARVNGRPIDTDNVNRTVTGLDARDTRTRHAVLSRMIDEELLVQHALDTGAAETNPEVRAALVRSAISRVNTEAAAEPLTEQELERFFQAHRDSYAMPSRFEVTPLYFTKDDLTTQAPFDFPTRPVSARTLTTYFGPTAADVVDQLTPGQTSAPLRYGDGFVKFSLTGKVAGRIPALADIHDLVLADALRERQERALEALLSSLHHSARIETHE
jgi:hypothetical protein